LKYEVLTGRGNWYPPTLVNVAKGMMFCSEYPLNGEQ